MAFKDRGVRGLETNQPVRLSRGSFIDYGGTGPSLFEDFLGIGATAADTPNVLITQSGTPTGAGAISASAGAPTAGHGGWLAGATDDVDAEIDEIALGKLPWISVARVGNGFAYGEIGFVLPAITARQMFFGLTDDETEGTGTNGSLNIQTGTTLVSVATNAAGFIFSTLATSADTFYVSSVNGDTDGAVVLTDVTETADDYTKLRVEVDAGGDAYFYAGISTSAPRSNIVPVFKASALAAVATTSLLLPVATYAATTTTAVAWEIDYMAGGGTE